MTIGLFMYGSALLSKDLSHTLSLYLYIYRYIFIRNQIKKSTGLTSRVFANGLGDRGSIPGRVIPKTQKMVLDAALLSTQHSAL